MDRQSGSSPRVWGILIDAGHLESAARFIPTRVGNTRPRSAAWTGSPVHPHACGEYKSTGRIDGMVAGSSPRVWGIRPAQWDDLFIYRFIPTRGMTPIR